MIPNDLITVRISTNFKDFPLKSQTPGGYGLWSNHRFLVDEQCSDCDWWIVSSGVVEREICYCDPSHTVFFANEPPVRKYSRAFLDQFAIVVTCDREVVHPGVMFGPYGLPWYVGVTMRSGKSHTFVKDARFGYENLCAMPRMQKTKRMSLICSGLKNLPGHIRRLEFIAALRQRFGNRIDFFGYDSTALPDKWEGLAPYAYHICLENSVCQDYWTEKIADPLLAFAMPVYYGCPNIGDYLPVDSMIRIDIERTEEAIGQIEELMESDVYERSLSAVIVARKLILDRYNFFAIASRMCANRAQILKRLTIYPECVEQPPKDLKSLVRRVIVSSARRWNR